MQVVNITTIDMAIVLAYLAITVGLGWFVSKQANQGLRGYFLGGNNVRWPILGVSNASGMFDVAGTMWMVYLLYVYGLKSVWIPWLWPIFNQIFNMVYLSGWLRRSGVLTGAEWITFRFGEGLGARVSHLVVVIFALFNVLGFLAYGFIGIGKFVAVFFPFDLVTALSLETLLPAGTQTLTATDPIRISAYDDLNARIYGLIFVALTSVYVIKGGLRSVVFTEVLQFFVMGIACIGIAVVAMQAVTAEQIAAATPQGWDSLWFGMQLDLDWSNIMPAVNERIALDGYDAFGSFMMLVIFKGISQSLAGLPPNYDMQRVLSTRSPIEAAKMSGMISVVLLPTRYLMITGLTVLALVYLQPELSAMGSEIDFEAILPLSMVRFVPPILLGLLLAGLISAFMSTFAATLNAAPAYVVNDIYKRYMNKDASERHYVIVSYAVSLVFVIVSTGIGLMLPSVNSAILWVVSALYGGYAAANILKWYWWRFNGYGFAWGMGAGLAAAVILPFTGWDPLQAFPLTFVLCLVGCYGGTWMTPPTDMETLKVFYARTRPWGFWEPVRLALEEERQSPVRANPNLRSDMMNVVVGTVWQTALTAAPVFFVIKEWYGFAGAMAVILGCSIWLKRFWWDRLEETHALPDETLPALEPSSATLDAPYLGGAR